MTDQPLLSIVIPAYHEAEGLAKAIDTIRSHADPLCLVEYIVVDDGSADETWTVIQALSLRHPSVKGLRLSRNFGKEAAITAGLKAAQGAVIVTIDADLQHPPKLIPEMFRRWQEGAKIINAVKQTRENEGPIKAWMTRRYFSLFHRLAGIDVGNAADFKMLDREVVDCLIALPEKQRFYRGLVVWLGFEQDTIPFNVAPRNAGIGKWSSLKLIRLALDSIVSFSTTPMHLMTFIGAFFAFLALALGARTFWLWMIGSAVPGFTTVILLLILIGSILMIGLGIIGVYIAKIYDEVKRRPEFIIQAKTDQEHRSPDSDRDRKDRPKSARQPGPELVREALR
jgi:glycosyltransferase involved in cell wall biosynthesis